MEQNLTSVAEHSELSCNLSFSISFSVLLIFDVFMLTPILRPYLKLIVGTVYQSIAPIQETLSKVLFLCFSAEKE